MCARVVVKPDMLPVASKDYSASGGSQDDFFRRTLDNLLSDSGACHLSISESRPPVWVPYDMPGSLGLSFAEGYKAGVSACLDVVGSFFSDHISNSSLQSDRENFAFLHDALDAAIRSRASLVIPSFSITSDSSDAAE